MNGPMMMVLALCGTCFIAWDVDPKGWKQCLLTGFGILVFYVVLFLVQVALYTEVVLRWLTF